MLTLEKEKEKKGLKNGKTPDKGSATLQKIQPDMNELNVSQDPQRVVNRVKES